MKNFKIIILIALLIASIVLSGCSGSDGSPGDQGVGDSQGGNPYANIDSTSEGELLRLVNKVAGLTRFFTYLVGIYFVARMLLIMFSSQINLVGGKPGAVADMATEMVFALLSFLIAMDTPKLAAAFSSLAANNMGAAVSSDLSAMGNIVEPIAGFVISLLGTLVFVGFIVNFVYTGLQGVIQSAIGAPSGITNAISNSISLVFSLALGLVFLRAGQWMFANLISF